MSYKRPNDNNKAGSVDLLYVVTDEERDHRQANGEPSIDASDLGDWPNAHIGGHVIARSFSLRSRIGDQSQLGIVAEHTLAANRRTDSNQRP